MPTVRFLRSNLEFDEVGRRSRNQLEPNQPAKRRQTIRIVVISGFVAAGVVAFLVLGGATSPKKRPVHPIADVIRQPATTTSTTTAPQPLTTSTTIPPTTRAKSAPPPAPPTTTKPPPPTTTPTVPAPASGPRTSEHYTGNGNLSGSTYGPGSDGFNLADVSSNAETEALPAGVKGLEWIGSCAGATPGFESSIERFVGDPKVFGFYLMDEPDPSSCPPADLKAESDWIHTHDPGTFTFIVEQDLSSSNHPTYQGGYNPANSDIDLYGLDP